MCAPACAGALQSIRRSWLQRLWRVQVLGLTGVARWHSGCNTMVAGPTPALLATPPTRACIAPPDALLEPGGVFFCWAESRLRAKCPAFQRIGRGA